MILALAFAVIFLTSAFLFMRNYPSDRWFSVVFVVAGGVMAWCAWEAAAAAGIGIGAVAGAEAEAGTESKTDTGLAGAVDEGEAIDDDTKI